MAFLKTNDLTTHEEVFGSKRLGQIIAVPGGRIDKVSVYLEPFVTDLIAAQNIYVYLEAYDLYTYPTGSPLASDYKLLSDITVKGFLNFRLEAYVPTTIAIVLRLVNGDANNYVAWRYCTTTSVGEELMISADDGVTWTKDNTKKFAYKTFSLVSNTIDIDNQTALIGGGSSQSVVDDTNAEWTAYAIEQDRTAISGDTVVVNFGDFVVTLVVDQSGSMTWNDRNGIRFDFLEDFITDFDASLPLASTATYSIIKFKGRRIGKLTIGVQGSESSGIHFDGVIIKRRQGFPPSGPTDPLAITVFTGLEEQFVDDGITYPLVPGLTYHYAVFSYATFGTTTETDPKGRRDYSIVVSPIVPPFGVADFKATSYNVDAGGVVILPTGTDIGLRKVSLTWNNPVGYTYDSVRILRRDDRFPDSPDDIDYDGAGNCTIVFSGTDATTSFMDTFSPGDPYKFVNGFTYYYRIITTNTTTGLKTILDNSLTVSVVIPVVDRVWEKTEPPIIVPAGFPITTPTVPALTVVESNGELGLSWVAGDAISKRYRLYYKETSFPIAKDSDGRNYDGVLLFDGSGTTFNHRQLTNGEPHFYVLIAMDEVENVSAPVIPLVSGRPPKPDADAVVFLPPDSVSNMSAEAYLSNGIKLTWTNPSLPQIGQSFYFGDTVRIVSTVGFLDSGTSESFIEYSFHEVTRQVSLFDSTSTVDIASAIQFARVPVINTTSIAAVISVTPLLSVQNLMSEASITITARLQLKNRTTNVVLTQIETNPIVITFSNPFSLAIRNEPTQQVSRRTWKTIGDDANCQEYDYSIDSFPGVYILSGNPFFSILGATYRGVVLTSPLDVHVELRDADTGNLTSLIKLPSTNTAQADLQITIITDESLDRSGAPTGDLVSESSLPLTLPPSNVPGDLIMSVVGTYSGYTRTVTLPIHYEPVLNIDLNLAAFQPDGVDKTEQSAFVYLAPFDAAEKDKIPVADFTVTDWSIRALCKNPPASVPIQLQPPGDVAGLGVKAYTRGGLANQVFWGPGEDVNDDLLYEISVKVQYQGMKVTGYGIVRLGPVTTYGVNRILLRTSPASNGFFTDTIYSDGTDSSTWEVLAVPQDEVGGIESGQYFVNAIISNSGTVPTNGLEIGRIVTITANIVGNMQGADVLNNIRIKTNMTGTSGKARTAKAKVQDVSGVGKALFEISVNSQVPWLEQTISEAELKTNIFYGTQFSPPQTAIYIVLTAYTSLEVNGNAVSYFGGGSDEVMSSPPCFIGLIEPLRA